MSRSGYCDDGDEWGLIRWRGAVASALRGKRGQAFLRELLTSLDALPAPRLIESALVTGEGCCAMGAVAVARGQDVSKVDPFERDEVADAFGIAEAMAAEIAYVNDEGQWRHDNETPEERFARVRKWVVANIDVTADELDPPARGEG
jgi:hypothetical protein